MDNELKRESGKSSAAGSKPRDTSATRSHDGAEGKTTAGKSTASGIKDQAKDVAEDLQKRAQAIGDKAADTVRDATDYARDRYQSTSNWASDRYDNASRGAAQAKRRSMSEIDRLRRGAEDLVTHNPIMIGVAGLAAGLLIGALLPRTQRENEAFGKWSDDMREQGKRYALDLAQHGREMVTEALTPDAEHSTAKGAPASSR